MWTHAVGKGGEEDKNRNEASPSIKLKKGGGGVGGRVFQNRIEKRKGSRKLNWITSHTAAGIDLFKYKSLPPPLFFHICKRQKIGFRPPPPPS